jgi:UDP-2,4-diacetamido-2,4,6-trideoxy-beta-L-altropyranose hydrolase
VSRAIIVANASVSVGGGHLRRCMVLGEALAARGWTVVAALCDVNFARKLPASAKIEVAVIQEHTAAALIEAVPDGCDVLIVDHYGLDAAFESDCRGWARRILVIDELADRRHDCDILVDQTPEREIVAYKDLVPAGCQILAGPNYALLHPNFARLREPHRPTARYVERGLISLGATDPHDMTSVAIDAFRCSGLALQLDIILGADAPHIARVAKEAENFANGEATVHVEVGDPASIVRHADIAIGAGGVSSLERCCLGVPSLIVSLADNQMGNALGIAKAGAAVFVGKMTDIDKSLLASELRNLAGDDNRRRAMTASARKLCDGLGRDRIAGLLEMQAV